MLIVSFVCVVVNDSIVLVDSIDLMLNKENARHSIMEASLTRLRPVLLTTFTTVAGLLPMAHLPGGDTFLKPLALSFAYGLLFATTVTLVFVPACYSAMVNVSFYFSNRPKRDSHHLE